MKALGTLLRVSNSKGQHQEERSTYGGGFEVMAHTWMLMNAAMRDILQLTNL
jgi:hypothetical protein